MIIQMAGEDLIINDEALLDEQFDVYLCSESLELFDVVIEKIEDYKGDEISLDDIDMPWALSMVKAHLQAALKWKQVLDEANRAGVDI